MRYHYQIFAERDGSRDRVARGSVVAEAPHGCLTEARDTVDAMEDAGEWPEGSDAILVLADGREFVLVSDWEPLS